MTYQIVFRKAFAISALVRCAFLFCLTTVPVWAQLAYTFNTTGLTSLTYNGTQYVDAVSGGASGTNTGIPWIQTYTQAGGSTYGSDFFGCPSISLSSSGNTVTGNCPAWTFHFSYTYSQPDANTLEISYTLYNDNTTNTMTKVNIPLVGIVVPHSYTDNENDNGNPVPISGITNNYLVWSSAEAAIFTTDTTNWWVGSQVVSNAPDSNHDTIDFQLHNQQSSGNCNQATVVPNALCQTYTSTIAPSSSYTIQFYLRFAPVGASQSSLLPELISAWNTANPSVLNWPDRRPIGELFLANNTDTSSTNPRGYFGDPSCNCTNQVTFNTRLSSYISGVLNNVSTYGFPLQGFIFWDLEGEESGSLNYVGDPRSLPYLAPQMDAEIDSVMSELTGMGYRVGVMLRADTFNYGTSLPATPCTYNDVFNSTDTGDNSYFQPPFFLSTGTPTARVYTCSQSTLTWGLGGYQSTWEQQSQAAADLISKATYAYNRWGATLFYVDSDGWYGGGGQYAPQIWKQIQAAVPNALFIPEHSSNVQFPYVSAYNDPTVSGAYNSGEARYQIPYLSAFFVSANNGTSMNHVAEIAAGMCHGDIYALQAWYLSGEAPVLAAAMAGDNCPIPPPPTGIIATIE